MLDLLDMLFSLVVVVETVCCNCGKAGVNTLRIEIVILADIAVPDVRVDRYKYPFRRT